MAFSVHLTSPETGRKVGEDGGDKECIPHDFHLFLQILANNMCFMMIDHKCSSRRVNPTISHLASKGRVKV